MTRIPIGGGFCAIVGRSAGLAGAAPRIVGTPPGLDGASADAAADLRHLRGEDRYARR